MFKSYHHVGTRYDTNEIGALYACYIMVTQNMIVRERDKQKFES